VDFYIAKVRE